PTIATSGARASAGPRELVRGALRGTIFADESDGPSLSTNAGVAPRFFWRSESVRSCAPKPSESLSSGLDGAGVENCPREGEEAGACAGGGGGAEGCRPSAAAGAAAGEPGAV